MEMGMGRDRNDRMDENEDRDWGGGSSSSLLEFRNRESGVIMEESLAALTALQPPPVPVAVAGETMVSTPGRGRKKEERIPQWGYHETKEFIAIRAELEKDFTQTKRNKTLWELISGKMKEKGFRRSADQCKCKWKNLVNRYKVCIRLPNSFSVGKFLSLIIKSVVIISRCIFFIQSTSFSICSSR
ncbi:hypothetical protein O6H91_06G026400 [Diphasiastrum complanatum]|uniref:Uncharacterized protein n=1 Tax=Diphasiastrum complanatum TaxID=34168 RepID=A0ACC2DBV8_DIPCM|nr:hypothetical protein O6H91_06G026400 [Diphasiastrum complanatum]